MFNVVVSVLPVQYCFQADEKYANESKIDYQKLYNLP